MRVASRPAPAADDLGAHRLVLRDGSVAGVRQTTPADRHIVEQFFRDLSPDARYERFLGTGQPSDALIDRFCTPDPAQSLTLLATRGLNGTERVVAVASYTARTPVIAEVAFAVADEFRGKGISTLLLEALAVRASAHGFQQFSATVFAHNSAMLDVFRQSGFEIRSKLDSGCYDIQLSLALSTSGIAMAEARRRRATVASLRPALHPRSIVVIGASRSQRKIGSRILQAIRAGAFQGSVFAVHPESDNIQGVRTFRSARDLPSGVELAIVAVPAAAVPSTVDDCAAAGVRSLVVITAGFAEGGAEGQRAQDVLVEKVRGYGMRMIGPNCMGVITTDPAVRLNASFSPFAAPAGHVALSSQSGALGIAILELASERQVGLSGFVSVGNKADVSSNDLIEYWEEDPETRVILLYLESFGNPRRFARIARRVALTKPIVALKAGRTRVGSRAAGSHTAAVATNDAVVSALFRQAGVIRAETIDEMFDIAACLDAQPLPHGSRVAIVTNAGGPGILAADACEGAGLTIPELSADTCDRLRAILPPTASLGNPIDMVAAAGPAEYGAVVNAVLEDPAIDSLIVIYTPIDTGQSPAILERIGEEIAVCRSSGLRDKPVLACVMTGSAFGALKAAEERIPTYRFPEHVVRALGRVSEYAAWRARHASLYWDFDDVRLADAQAICQNALNLRGPGWLTVEETSEVLGAFGLPVVAGKVARTAEEAVTFADALSYPVAAKVVSSAVLHKTDVGGVRLNLKTSEEVRTAFADIVAHMRARAIGPVVDELMCDGVLIQPMVIGGIETIVGIAHDPIFGSVIGFGLGGVDVELLGDMQFGLAPLSDQDADELLHGIRGFRILEGFRGKPGADLAALRDVLLRVSKLAQDVPAIVELDLNPLMALPAGAGCRIVDARIKVDAGKT